MKFTIFFFVIFISNSFAQIVHKKKAALLGSPFEITVLAEDTIAGENFCKVAIAEVKRIENLISDWIPTSQISKVNQNAGLKPIKVDEEVFDLIERALKISKITNY